MKKCFNSVIAYLSICLCFFIGLCYLPSKVNAADSHNFSLYGVKCPMDLLQEAYDNGAGYYSMEYACFEEYAWGIAGIPMDGYIIEEGDDIDPGTTVMLVVKYKPNSAKDMTAFNLTLNYDTSIWTSVHTSTSDFYNEDLFPKSGRGTNWALEMNVSSAGTIDIFGSDDTTYKPLTEEMDLYYIMMELDEDVTAGRSVSINFGQEAGDNDVSNASGASVDFTTTDLNFSVYGSQSQDASLGTLTVTNSETNYSYPLTPDFKKGDSTNTTYSTVVPNNVDSIVLGATANNEHASIANVGVGTKDLVVGDNQFQITVTSQLGNVVVYNVNVYRLSNETTLNSLTLSNNIDIGELQENVYLYSATNIPYATLSTVITAIPKHEKAYISSGDGTWTFTNAGDTKNVRNVVVNAENCLDEYASVEGNTCTSQTYTIEVSRIAASTNNYLSSLTVDGTSVPNFNKEKTVYNLDPVSNDTTILDIEAIVEDTGKATIESGTGEVTLAVGDNTFDVVVKAEDGSPKTYTINVRRLSSNKELLSLTVTSSPSGKLSPTFLSSFTGEYTYTYDPTVADVTITAVVSDTNNAYVYIADTSDGATPTGTKTLNTASETFSVDVKQASVVVVAEDGTERVYPINLTRLKSSNNYLSSLSLSKGKLSPTFESTTRIYTATVDGSVDSVEVYATPAVSYGKVISITGNTNLQFGVNTIEVVVQAEDGTKASYIINLTREKYTIATLKDLKVNDETITGFDPSITEYDLDDVSYPTTSLDIEAIPTNSYATVTGDGNVSLKTTDNEIVITVTAHDGVTKEEYVINVYREQNDDNSVYGLTVAGVAATLGDDGNYTVTLPNSKDTVYPSDIVISTSDDATVNKTLTLPLSTTSENLYQFTVTSEAGETEIYNIYITREKSSDTSISKVILTIGDDSSRYCMMEGNSCTIGVPVDTTDFSLDAIISDVASISPNNGTTYTMASTESTKTIILTVTAEDNSVSDYQVIVERQKSSNNNLSTLTVDGVEVSNFNANTQLYNISVPGTTSEVLVGAEVEDIGKATITTDLSNKFILDYGLNQVDVVVKSEDGQTKTYSILITRQKNIDATLKDLQVNGVTITDFKPEGTEYLLNDVPYETTSLNVYAEPTDSLAKASGDGLISLKTGDNEIVITVTAHDTSVTKIYTIKVNRTENDDTGIQSISIAGNQATYNETTGNYEVTVPNNVTEANSNNVEVVVNDPIAATDKRAEYTVNPTELLTTTTNNVVIVVTAEDGSIQPYNLVVTREKSKVATLSTLTLTNGSFNPSFDPEKLEYTITVPVDTTEFDITATKTDAMSKIISGTNEAGTAHYTMSSSTQKIEIVVVSEDLSVTKTYVLNIVRTSSSVNTLDGITVSDGEKTYDLTPEFDPDTTEYTVNVGGDVDSVDISAELTDSRASIISGTGPVDLNVGENQVTIIVQSESGAKGYYIVKIIRDKKTDNALTDLTVDGETVPNFDPKLLEYTLDKVDYTKTSIEIGATLSDSDASVSGTGKKGLATGTNRFEVVVTAQNGTDRTYVINIERAKNDNANLSLLSVNGYTLSPTFTSSTVDYTLTVDSKKETFSPNDVTAIAEDTNATVTKQEEITLSTTVDNFYTIDVVAEDGVTKKTYTIQIIRPKSSDATLASVNLTNATISPTFQSTKQDGYTLSIPYGTTDFSIEGIPTVSTTKVYGNGDYTTANSTIQLTTQAEDGTILVYSFNVAESASNDTTLSSLSVAGYPFDKTFQSTDLLYSIGNISYGTTQLKIDAVATNTNATIEYYVDGTKQTSNIVSIPQVLGDKTITVRVIAADGISSRDYTISYTVVNSNNAYLSNIVPSVGEIDFNKGTFNYTDYTVENSVTSVDFEITTEDSNAKITVNGESYFTPKTITVSDLPVGTTSLTILVTAQDGTTTQTYNVVIRRQAATLSDDANLSSLEVVGYTLTPNFDMDVVEYSIGEIPFSLTELTVLATPNMGTSTISYSVNGVGQSDNTVEIPKTEGQGAITVKVVAEDKKTVKSYKITYTKTASTNAYLSHLSVDKGDLSPTFDKLKNIYTVNVDDTVTSIDLTAITEDEKATLKINGETYTSPHTITISPLNTVNTDVVIVVTAENGNAITYKVTITKSSSISEKITSVAYGHTIDDDYIRTAELNATVSDMKDQLDNPNEYLEIWDASETSQISDSDIIATGMIVKLMIDGVEHDRKVIVVKGDTNGDAEIDLFDAVKILNHYLVKTKLTDAYLEAGYVNDDEDLDLFDSVLILNHYLGKTSIH